MPSPSRSAVELERVVPVLEALAAAARAGNGSGVRLSVDTVKPEVATAALAAGASLVNDISASLWEVAAAGRRRLGGHAHAGTAAHHAGEPALRRRGRRGPLVPAGAGGPGAGRRGCGEVWVDPGIGFGKTTAHNLSLLRHLDDLVEAAAAAGCAGVMVGTSRKRFLGVLAAGPGSEEPAPVADRVEGSLATAAAALVAGVGMVRVHDVSATVQMARLYGPAA